jgi:hypothetical protein
MPGSRIALYAVLLLAALIALNLIFRLSGDAAAQDADTVYCLAPAHQGELINAALDLGLVGSGSSVAALSSHGTVESLPQWRAKDDPDFQRACDALAAPAMPSGGGSESSANGILQLLNVLLPVAVGAMLALAVDEVKQGADRRWAQAEELRTAWSGFRGVAESYVKEQRRKLSGGPLPGDLDAPRRELAAILRRIQLQQRRSRNINRLKSALGTSLGSGITQDWPGGDSRDAGDRREAKADGITASLEEFDSSLQLVASKLERKVWLSSRL